MTRTKIPKSKPALQEKLLIIFQKKKKSRFWAYRGVDDRPAAAAMPRARTTYPIHQKSSFLPNFTAPATKSRNPKKVRKLLIENRYKVDGPGMALGRLTDWFHVAPEETGIGNANFMDLFRELVAKKKNLRLLETTGRNQGTRPPARRLSRILTSH